tara:strand:- start:19 stop:240 length:222 start_codon:yes stop_codon:yes gene_type:complete
MSNLDNAVGGYASRSRVAFNMTLQDENGRPVEISTYGITVLPERSLLEDIELWDTEDEVIDESDVWALPVDHD